MIVVGPCFGCIFLYTMCLEFLREYGEAKTSGLVSSMHQSTSPWQRQESASQEHAHQSLMV